MWILLDWLDSYDSTPLITDGPLCLEGVRLLSDSRMDARRVVYLHHASVSDVVQQPGVFCTQGHDIIFLKTDDISGVLNDLLAAFDFYEAWESDLGDCIHAGGSLQDIIDRCTEVLEHPLAVQDTSQRVLASSAGFDAIAADTADAVIIDLNGRGRLIAYQQPVPLSEGKRQLATQLGHILEDWFVENANDVHVTSAKRVVENLLAGSPQSIDDAHRELKIAGWDDIHEKVLFVIDLSKTTGSVSEVFAASAARRLPRCFCTRLDDYVVVLSNLDLVSREDLINALSPLIVQSGAMAALSYPFDDPSKASARLDQTRLALRYTEFEPGAIRRCEDFALLYIVNQLASHTSPMFMHPAVIALHEYDEARDGELCETLYAYLLNHQSLVKTAETLCLHRNTLVYRLKRIHELVDVNIEDPDTMLHLLLSLCMLKGYILHTDQTERTRIPGRYDLR